MAQPDLFDEGVEAARNACVAGASLASAAIVASAWYDNPLTGVGALLDCLRLVRGLPHCVDSWRAALSPRPHPTTLDEDWVPGFGFSTASQAGTLLASARLIHDARHGCVGEDRLGFFLRYQAEIVPVSGALNATGLAALVFADHSTPADEAERAYLLTRVDVAVAEAARARAAGLASFPFFTNEYSYEGTYPPARPLDLEHLMREVGL